jgi:hypothetical protein
MDQDLRWSEAWLGKCQRLASVIRVVAGLPPQAHRCSRGWGGHLARPWHGAGGGVVGWMMGRECWKSSLYPLDPRCSLLVITPDTLPHTIGTLDPIVVPKIKTKIVLTVGVYFKRVSYFSNAVRSLTIL